MTSALKWLFGLPQDAFQGVDEWRLRLMGMPQNLWAVMGLLALFAALAWLTVRSYQREGRTHRKVKLALAGARLATLAILLALAMQPAVVMRYTRPLTSEVAVLVDDTLSMRWADRWASSEDRSALAAFLKMSPERLDGQDRPARLAMVQQALGREGGALARLAAAHPLTLFRFGSTGKGGYTETMTPLGANANEARNALGQLSASGYETNLGRAVREALDKLEGRRLAAMVIVSDGQNTSASAAGRLAAARDLLRDRGVPVYAVAVGDDTPPRNITLAQLQGPGEVRKGSLAAFTAFVAHRHYAGQAVTVELFRSPVGAEAWEKVGASEAVTLAGDGPDASGKLQEVPLRVEAGEVGEFVYRAAVAPRPDEMVVTDNEARCTLRVSEEKVSVLLVSGDGGWEYQFLRAYLLRHPEHYKVSTWQQNAERALNQDASSGMKLSALPITRDDLFKYDVIILHDPREVAGSLDAAFLGLLEEFAGKHHGGLCYIAGSKFAARTLGVGGSFDALAKLLPVIPGRPTGLAAQLRAARTAFGVELTMEGGDHPMMQLGPAAAENKRVWDSLPGVYRSMPVSRLRPLATALLVSADISRQTGDGQREPLVAIQYYGKGRVLYHGFDSTWRWRYADDTRTYQRFWANAIDFLAAGRLEKKRILITTGGEVFDAGSEIRVRVEAYNRDYTPMGGRKFTVTMLTAGGEQPRDHELTAARDGFFEGTILADRIGAFQIRAKCSDSGQADWMEEEAATKRLEVRLPEEEFRRPEANYQSLRELAGEPQRFLRLHEVDRLAERLPATEQVSVQETPHSIWNTMAALVALGALLLGEWAVRKWFNMV